MIRDAGARVHELAQAMDLFWLTSEPRAEGMSNTLAEAQALGIPAIVTRSGAVHENVRDGVTGFLLPPHDIDGIVRESRRLLDDPRCTKSSPRRRRAHQGQLHRADHRRAALRGLSSGREIRARKNRAA